jgi:hypothetical protein
LSNNSFVSRTDSDIAVDGAALSTVTVLGGAKTQAAGSSDGEGGILINATTSLVYLNVTAGTDVKSLTVVADSALDLTVSGSALKSVDTTGVANGVYLDESGLTSVTTGAGMDEVYLNTTSVKDVAATTTTDETVNVTVSTGAGDDILGQNASGNGLTTITTGAGNDEVYLSVETTSGRAIGSVNVDLGAGDDTFELNTSLEAAMTKLTSAGVVTTSDIKIAGGEGTDTFAIYDTTINAATYERLALNVTGFEVIEFYEGASAIDAAKLGQFSKLVFNETSSVTKVAAAQTIETFGGLTATAAGYVAAKAAVEAVLDNLLTDDVDEAAPAVAAVPTVYAGTLNIVQGNSGTLVANADVVNLTVAAMATANDTNIKSQVGTNLESSSTTITAGNFQTLTATLQAVSGSGTSAGQESLSSLTISGVAEINGVKTITVSGQGTVSIDANAVFGATLTTIDLSGLTALVNLNNKGEQVNEDVADSVSYGYQNLSTSMITGNDTVAETIKLGGADDLVITGSKGAKMDTITGFELVASATVATTVDATRSDAIDVFGADSVDGNDFVKVTIDAGNSTLALALDQVAKGTVNQALFVVAGNTYLYVDADAASGASTTYSAANDTLIQLTGVYNLDLLAQVVNGTVIS